MFVETPSKNERLLKYALVALGATLVAAMLAALFFFGIGTDQQKEPTKQEASLTPEAELKLQEETTRLIKEGDLERCDRISDVVYRSACVENIASDKANETQDISYCRYIEGKFITKESCERQILIRKSIENEDGNVCGETESATVKKDCEDAYFLEFANRKNDPSFCNRNGDQEGSDRCWNRYQLGRAVASGRMISDCAIFRGSDVQDDCSALVSAETDTDPMKFKQACGEQKTGTFSIICAVDPGSPMGGVSPDTASRQ